MNIFDLLKEQLTQINAYSLIVWFIILGKLFSLLLKNINNAGNTTYGLMERYRAYRNQFDNILSLTSVVNNLSVDIKKTNDKINVISQMVIELMEIQDNDKEFFNSSRRAELKDRIAQSYRYHKANGQWTKMDEEAFRDLIDDYEAHGGQNSFVHSICEPESYTWKIVD